MSTIKIFLENDLGLLVTRVQRQLYNASQKFVSAYDLTPDQCGLIVFIYENIDVTPSELSLMLERDKPGTVRLIQKLEKKCLVERRYNRSDQRSYSLYLTRNGEKMLKVIRAVVKPQIETLFDQVVSGFTDSDINQFKLYLKSAYDNLQKMK